MKKLRALLRLARGELGEQTFARENACFRDAARELAGARDADVMLDDAEGARAAGRPRLGAAKADPGHGAAERRPRRREAAAARSGGDPARGARARRRLAARARLVRGAVGAASSAPTGAGGATSRRRGPSASVEALHEWRKRVKELWYHHTLLRCAVAAGDDRRSATRRTSCPTGSATTTTSRCSPAGSREHAGAEPEFFEAVDAAPRASCRAEAFALGGRLYAEKPRGVRAAGCERLWDAAQSRS